MASRVRRGSLGTYDEKRDFKKTEEPRGEPRVGHEGPRRFVVQKHAASRLHYDLRLEVDGVLKSWAVPRGPSLDPADRRLAVQTEDHPLAYAAFEGTIPRGEYGGGAMLIWDEGVFLPEGEPAEALARGRMAFTLEGKKLKGRFHLVRIASRKDGRGEEKSGQNQWLFMKSRDEHAARGVTVDKLPEASVKTGRNLDDVQRKTSVPAFIEPALCTSVEEPPRGPGWLHEPKIDGYRILARKDAADVNLFTRSGLDWTARFPAVARAVRALPVDNALLDGEMAVVDAHGAEFHALQRALAEGDTEVGVAYFVFDLLFVDGNDLRDRPLLERKEALARVLGKEPRAPLEAVPFHAGRPDELLARVTELGLEGIVSKRADSRYESARTRSWLKVRLLRREDFVVVGFTDLGSTSVASSGARPSIGALLVAARDHDGRLSFRGRVGTGYTDRDRGELASILEPLERPSPPVTVPKRARGGSRVRWTEPVVVVEAAYRELTGDGLLRQSVFHGVRRDKSGHDVTRGEPADPSEDVVAGVRISNPQRVLYPGGTSGDGARDVRKLDLARYVEAVAPLMLPHVAGRPLAVVRCPEGSEGPCFYQKRRAQGMPRAVRAIDVIDERNERNERVPQLMVEDAAGLVALVQMGVLEIHPWGVAPHHPERPDRVIFDLDPDEGLPWSSVVEAARLVKMRVEADGLECFVKTTGGKGLHVVIPLHPGGHGADWETVRTWARDIATELVALDPRRYTVNMRKSARAGRVFIDHLRNTRGSTAIAPWSMRARPGAPVAVPVDWSELDTIRGDQWTVLTLVERMAGTADPWRRYFHVRQGIPRGGARAMPRG